METTTLKSLQVITIKRGSHKVVYTWDNGQTSSVMFSNKKDAEKYVSFVKNTDPNMTVSTEIMFDVECFSNPHFLPF